MTLPSLNSCHHKRILNHFSHYKSFYSKRIKQILFFLTVVLSQEISAQTCTIIDQTVSVVTTPVCGAASGTITVGSSETGLFYYLRNNADNSVIGNQRQGTGAPLSFTTGTLTSSIAYNVYAAKPDSGLYFNGVNNYITSASQINYSSGTWEAWIKKNDWSDHHDDRLFGNGINFSSSGSFYISLHPAGFHFRYGGSGDIGNNYVLNNTTLSFAANSWHHLAATWAYDGTSTVLKLFIDGAQTNSVVAGLLLTGTSLSYINGGGASGTTPYYGPGTMDDLRIWNVAKTAAEIRSTYNNCLTGTEPNLTNYWKFDDAAGTTALDNVTGDHNALVNIDPSTCWTRGIIACSCSSQMTQIVTIPVTPKPATPKVVNSSLSRCGGGAVTIQTSAGGPYFAWHSSGSYSGTNGCVTSTGRIGSTTGSTGSTGSSTGSGTTSTIVTSGNYTTAILTTDTSHSYVVFSADSVNGALCLSDTSQSICIIVALACTDVSIPSINNSLKIFPNPSNSIVEVSFEVGVATDLTVNLYSINGQLVFTDNRKRYLGQYVSKLDLSELIKGLYYLSISTETYVLNRKIVIE